MNGKFNKHNTKLNTSQKGKGSQPHHEDHEQRTFKNTNNMNNRSRALN